jgi:predicted RNase H-like nuclease
MAIPTRVADRLSAGLKKYQPVLTGARSRDVNESDTSMIVTDLLAEVFGYDKYSEVTRELCIRGTYCDLATRMDGKFQSRDDLVDAASMLATAQRVAAGEALMAGGLQRDSRGLVMQMWA